jgi:rod shape determining protein RodA
LFGLLVAGALAAFAAVQLGVLDDYQVNRLLAFTNPALDPQGIGYNTNQARIGVGSGGLLGTGLFEGSQTSGQFIPEQETDFIFSVVGEELGFVGSATLITLFAILLWRALHIAVRAEDLFGALVATGIACWFTFQMFENIGMVIGIMPVTGVPLPFVSYGGSSMFANWMAIGLLQNVHLRRALR